MSCRHGNHEDACDICNEVDAAYDSGYAAALAAPAVANAAVSDTSILPDEFWELVSDCGGTKDLGKNARLLQEWVKKYARAAIATAQQAAPKTELTDDQLHDIWINRDCMDAIQAGDIRAQFICAARAAIAVSAPNAQLVEALQGLYDLVAEEVADGEYTEQAIKARAALSAIKGEKA